MVTCLNMVPSKSGISSDFRPASIILGSTNTEYNKPRITFGAYAQVYIGTTNRTKQKTVGVIALRLANKQSEDYLMLLST